MTDEQLTRRQLIERGALGAAAISLPALLAACGGSSGIKGGAKTTGTTAAVNRTLATTLTISNWPLYIDIDEKTKKRPTIDQFTKEFGVKVKYIEDVNDNDQFYGKVQSQLRNEIGRASCRERV